MDNNDIRNRSVRRDERDERDVKDDDVEKAAGDILGVSRVTPDDNFGPRADDDGNAHQPPLPEERDHVGSRDLTDGTTGGTGPDTGGHGVHRRGSGATGTDLGNG